MKRKILNICSLLLISSTIYSCSFIPAPNISLNNSIVISINEPEKSILHVGDTLNLTATINNEVSTDIIWSSSDENVIEIDENGSLLAKNIGVATIYASYSLNESKNTSITFEVTGLNTNISISITNKINELMIDEEHKLKVNLLNSTMGIEYSSSDEEIASIDFEGFLYGRKKGECTIYATSKENPSIKDSFNIKVLDNDEDRTEIKGYKLKFADYFDGTSLNTNYWSYQIGDGSQYGIYGWGNNEKQYYQESNVSLRDGKLIITGRKENRNGFAYTSGRIRTANKVAMKYGRVEAKIKLPVGNGLWPAFWLLPDNSPYGGWPNSGEIDIMEAKGRITNETSGALHFANPNKTHNFISKPCPFRSNNLEIHGEKSITDYHIYALEWEENEMRWFVDDYNFMTINSWTCATNDYPAPFNTNFHILLNLAIGGNFDNNILPNDSDLPCEMVVDYVKWYQ